jgi:hypothetical protein
MLILINLLLALTIDSYAQSYNISSAPFNLVLISTDPTLNGNTLSACRTGVIYFTLCPSRSSKPDPHDRAVLYHNTSIDAFTGVRIHTTPFHLCPNVEGISD